jgi:hypothetical protein
VANTAATLLASRNPLSALNHCLRRRRWIVRRRWKNSSSRCPGDHVLPKNRWLHVGVESFACGDKKHFLTDIFWDIGLNCGDDGEHLHHFFGPRLRLQAPPPPIIKFFNWKKQCIKQIMNIFILKQCLSYCITRMWGRNNQTKKLQQNKNEKK